MHLVPGFQLAGVATGFDAVSWRESRTLRISLKEKKDLKLPGTA